jgi:isopentenyldiphosphate isomerase
MDAERPVIIVDDCDQEVGWAMRSRMRAENLTHRCTAVLCLSTSGDALLVHQRAADKAVWPSYWDLVAGGVVEVGEELESAAKRELAEELGIHAPVSKVGSGRFCSHEVDVFMHVWIAHHDGPFRFVDGEVQRAEWLTPESLRSALSERDWCLDSVAVALPLLGAWSDRWRLAG